MKILIVSQRFYPENFRINDIALTLKKNGNDVWVLTGIPNYPAGKYYEGYNAKSVGEDWNGIHIIRSYERERKHGPINRFLNYYSFALSAKKIIKSLPGDFDVILVNELSPIMAAEPAIEYKKLHGTPILMYEMDLWPDSLVAGGISQHGLIYKYYENVSKKIYSAMDLILVSSKPHIKRIREITCGKAECEYLPQYAEEIFVRKPKPCSRPDGKTIFLFAGNIGKAQSIGTIYEAAKLVRDKKNIEIWIAGNGTDLPKLKQMMHKEPLPNIRILGSLPLKEMPAYYEKATAFLLTLSADSYCSMTLPGKFQSYLAFGKPIIASAGEAVENEMKGSDVGFCCKPCDPRAFANLLEKLALFSDENLAIICRDARIYYDKCFAKSIFFEKLNASLGRLAS